MNFIGRYYHALEQKGRVSIPKVFRESLGNQAVITQGLDGCLFIFTTTSWEEVARQASSLPFTSKTARDWVRLLANSAVHVELDKLGRILVPDYLQRYANLQKQVVVVGSFQRIELWDQERYHTYLEDLEARAEQIAENVGELT